MALAPFTQRVVYLDDGDWAEDPRRRPGDPRRRRRGGDAPDAPAGAVRALIGKGNHRHFMHKRFTSSRSRSATRSAPTSIPPPAKRFGSRRCRSTSLQCRALAMVACGTSFHAAMIARYWLEGVARLPVDLDIASEYRYRSPVPAENGLALFISQSGETIDTLSALRYAKTLALRPRRWSTCPRAR